MVDVNSTRECNRCGKTLPVGGDDGLMRHHIIPRALGGTDDESNIEWLCHSCHGKVTWQLKKSPDGIKRKDKLVRLSNDVAGMLEKYQRPNESANEVVYRLLHTIEEGRELLNDLADMWQHNRPWQDEQLKH